jgi:adhesin/invasin
MRTGTRRIAIGLLAALATVGCDKVPLTAPGSSTVTLTTAAVADGSTEVTATVLEQAGTPVQNGTTVRFTSSLGTMNPAEVQTRNGMATSRFSSNGDSGEATITASSGSATQTVKLNVGLAAIDSVTIRASTGTVPATGGTVTLTARVVAAGGNPLSGVPVTFSTTAGTLSSGREVTDGNGEASTRLTTDSNATVSATAGTKTTQTPVTITAVNPVPTPSITVAGTASTATSAGQLWTFTATVENNSAVGSPVKFEWTFGDGTSADTNGRSIGHVYTEELKVFTVTVRAIFANGSSVSASTQIITADFTP